MNLDKAQEIWQEVKMQSFLIFQKEPALEKMLNAVFFQNGTMAESIAARLARKLCHHSASEKFLQEIMLEAFEKDSNILCQIASDLLAYKDRDPACTNLVMPILYFKGFQAIACYRVAHFLFKNGRTDMAFYFQSLISEVFAVDIHPEAKFGCGIFLDHATGFVAGQTSVVENNVSILHGVTLGGNGKEENQRHPTVRTGVLIGAGAKILGNIEIGEGAKIGAGSVVLEDVPPHTTVAGVPAKIVNTSLVDSPAIFMDHNINSCQ